VRARPLLRLHWQLIGRRRDQAEERDMLDVLAEVSGEPWLDGGRQPLPELPARRPEPYTPPLTGFPLAKLRQVLVEAPGLPARAGTDGRYLADLLRLECPDPDVAIARQLLIMLDYANDCQQAGHPDLAIRRLCDAVGMAAVELTDLDRAL